MIPDDDLIYNNGCISARRVGAELLPDPSIGRGPAHHHTLPTHLLHSISCLRTGALAPIGMPTHPIIIIIPIIIILIITPFIIIIIPIIIAIIIDIITISVRDSV